MHAVARRTSFLTFIFISYITALSAETTPKRVAILNIDAGTGATRVQSEVSMAYLREAVVNSKVYTVIERTDIDVVMKEQAFQQSGCTDTECAVKIGQLLAAEKIIFGVLRKIDNKYVLEVRMVDVGKGQVDTAATARADSLEGLEKAANIIVEKFIRSSGLPVRQPAQAEKPGWRIFVPGFAHFHQNDASTGALLFGGFLVMASNYQTSLTAYRKAQDDYKDPVVPFVFTQTSNAFLLNYLYFQDKRKAIKLRAESADIALGLLAVYWAIAAIYADSEFDSGPVSMPNDRSRTVFSIAAAPDPSRRSAISWTAAMRFAF